MRQHRRHLKELVGKIEPKSGLLVSDLPAFDFEYQVRRHLRTQRKQWPEQDPCEIERRIRLALAVGCAWLWPEPTQLDLFQ